MSGRHHALPVSSLIVTAVLAVSPVLAQKLTTSSSEVKFPVWVKGTTAPAPITVQLTNGTKTPELNYGVIEDSDNPWIVVSSLSGKISGTAPQSLSFRVNTTGSPPERTPAQSG